MLSWMTAVLLAAAPGGERPASPAETVRKAVAEVCLPYVADDRPLPEVERAAGLTRVWRGPDLFAGRFGVDYESVGPGQRDLTLYDNIGRRVRGWPGLRACELVVDVAAPTTAEAVRSAVLAREGFAPAARAASPHLHLCGAGLEPVNVLVNARSGGRSVVSVLRRPGEGSPCPAR